MSFEEMITFCEECAEFSSHEGVLAAEDAGNYYLGVTNCEMAFSSWHQKGLIEWRHGLSPVQSFRNALVNLKMDWERVSKIGDVDKSVFDVPFHLASYLASLISAPDPLPFFCPYPAIPDDLDGMTVLDLAVGKFLYGERDEELWKMGMDRLDAAHEDLALKTYSLYERVLNGDRIQ